MKYDSISIKSNGHILVRNTFVKMHGHTTKRLNFLCQSASSRSSDRCRWCLQYDVHFFYRVPYFNSVLSVSDTSELKRASGTSLNPATFRVCTLFYTILPSIYLIMCFYMQTMHAFNSKLLSARLSVAPKFSFSYLKCVIQSGRSLHMYAVSLYWNSQIQPVASSMQ
jgi:hypothetical protein